MKQVKKPSAIPVYGVAAVFVLYNLLLPMYSLLHVLLCAALAAGCFVLLRKKFPGETVWVEQPAPAPDTGNPALDEAILQGRETVAELKKLDERIPDQEVSARLQSIETLTADIFRQVEENQDKLTKIRQTMNYYLPTTLKLVRRYAELQDSRDMQSVQKILGEIRDLLGSVETALHRQLDSLYEHDVIDITADIQVMEQMMKSQGLTGDDDFKKE